MTSHNQARRNKQARKRYKHDCLRLIDYAIGDHHGAFWQQVEFCKIDHETAHSIWAAGRMIANTAPRAIA